MATSPFGPQLVQRSSLAPGDAGTAQTIARIRQLVEQGKRSLEVNRAAIAIVWNAPQFDEASKARAIFDWVRANCRFIRMVVGAQTLRTAEEILRVRAGDCANLNAVLIPALLETIGIPARLVTISSPNEDPNEFTHVYAEAFVSGRWIAMDVARPGAEFGREPEIFARKRIWDLDSAQWRDAKKLNGLGDAATAANLITAASQGAADVILASSPNTVGYGVVSTSGPQPAQIPGTSYYAQPSSASGYGTVGSQLLGIPSWVWLLLAVGVAFAALSGRGKK